MHLPRESGLWLDAGGNMSKGSAPGWHLRLAHSRRVPPAPSRKLVPEFLLVSPSRHPFRTHPISVSLPVYVVCGKKKKKKKLSVGWI